MENKFLRNKDLIQQNKLDEITIVGLGGIGSFVCQLAATMGFRSFNLFDPDIMEEHNFGTTGYPEAYYDENSDNKKIVMAEKLIADYGFSTYHDVNKMDELFTIESDASPITIVCTDDMESRREVYSSWLQVPDRKVLVDLRMEALEMLCITTTKENDEYMKYWYPSSQVEDAPCTMKHTIFCASIIAGLGLNQLFNFLTGRYINNYIFMGLSLVNVAVHKEDDKLEKFNWNDYNL